MGTRADFYVGTGPDAEWIGSISYDGDPNGPPKLLLRASSEATFRARATEILSSATLSTLPTEGWPWPWEDSRTTDFAYAWCSDGQPRVSSYGRAWTTPADLGCEERRLEDHEVRDMSSIKASVDTIIAKSGLRFLR